MSPQTAVLYINRWDSRCGACNHGADPDEKAHVTRLGYGDHDHVGCGATFTAVSSDYNDMAADVQKMRPDLPPVWSRKR